MFVAEKPEIASFRAEYAKRADVCEVLERDMNCLYLLAFLLTANHKEAEQCFVATVDDDGPGIPEDRLEEVFEPFVRLEESRSNATGGAGLGLTLARSIAREHGGDIVLENRRSGGRVVGLRVSLRLPRDKTRLRSETPASAVAPEAVGS